MKIRFLHVISAALISLLVIFNLVLYYLNIDDCNIFLQAKKRTGIVYDFISDYKEEKMISSYGDVFFRTWREYDNIYDVLSDSRARMIYSEPEIYLSDSINVIIDKNYDQTQKLFIIILMQDLSIKKYLCFMKAVNRAYEKGVIDKEIAARAIWPDVNVKGSSLYYWWLPAWRHEFLKYGDELSENHDKEDVLSGWMFWNAW